jgi:antagonist of KipI
MKDRMPARISVVKPGWFTTVQDLGRYGYQQFGVPVAGAMDRFSAVVGNRLVGNPDHAALVEVTLKGPELLFEEDAVIAITGGDLSPSLDGASIPLWEAIELTSGSRLTFGSRGAGSRAYVAIAGGVDVPPVLGSRSTNVPSATGGLKGCPLAQGDILQCGPPFPGIAKVARKKLPIPLRPRYGKPVSLRVIPGPQQGLFPEESLTILTGNPYTVAPQSDRMGFRLTGPRVARETAARFISDATAMGALQVPSDEQPILLMADRQTTGGYPKIAVVISADLHLAAQMAPGDTVRFKTTTLSEAYALIKERRAGLDIYLPPTATPM